MKEIRHRSPTTVWHTEFAITRLFCEGLLDETSANLLDTWCYLVSCSPNISTSFSTLLATRLASKKLLLLAAVDRSTTILADATDLSKQLLTQKGHAILALIV